MASTPLTLAALATSAVPGLEVSGVRGHTSSGGGSFFSAVIASERGELIVRVPTHPGAEVQQSAELLGHAALTEGARTQLPFDVPRTLGLTRAGDTRAVVSTFLDGEHATLATLADDSVMLQRLAEAIAAVHELPVQVVHDGGLPVRNAEEVRLLAARLVQRAVESGVLPATVRQRWEEMLRPGPLWSFEPTVVHGSLDADALLVSENRITGVLGWNELGIGDPAADLAWLLQAGNEVFETALAHYTVQRGVTGQQELTARAKLYHELDVAKWLLHGLESHDQSIVDDAVTMLDKLVDRLGLMGAEPPRRRVLTENEVEQLLDKTPEVPFDSRSETAEYDALDEDRVFAADSDFEERELKNGAKADATSDAKDGSQIGSGAADSKQEDLAAHRAAAAEAETAEMTDLPPRGSSKN